MAVGKVSVSVVFLNVGCRKGPVGQGVLMERGNGPNTCITVASSEQVVSLNHCLVVHGLTELESIEEGLKEIKFTLHGFKSLNSALSLIAFGNKAFLSSLILCQFLITSLIITSNWNLLKRLPLHF